MWVSSVNTPPDFIVYFDTSNLKFFFELEFSEFELFWTRFRTRVFQTDILKLMKDTQRWVRVYRAIDKIDFPFFSRFYLHFVTSELIIDKNTLKEMN